MSEINYKELREAAEQATQDEWVAYILPGHNGIYPARTSEGRHCGYFIDWPGVCQGRESINMSIRTYAVNCNDAWLNTEGDDISGSYVKYKDHQEVVAALEAKCAALAAENAGLKDYLAPIGLKVEGTPATDTFLDEVRAQGVEMFADHLLCPDLDDTIRDFAAQLRKGGNQ
ncbi:TPA: ead/Ea22-like family protein [Escherichia coli]|nr:ead/Ea22-like family protein [Escherichia coli]